MTNAVCEAETFTAHLCGFSQALNWKATEFLRHLPRVRVCSLCGVVPSEAHLVECNHVFCKTCYTGVVGCGQRCPIDDDPFDEYRVTSLKFAESDLLKWEVRCWNKHRGCDFSGSLADVLSHFHEVCTFHGVRCVKCHKMVSQRDMLDHYTGGCEGESGEEQRVPLAERILKTSKEVEAVLATLADTQASLRDSLNNLTAETRARLQSVENRIEDQNAELAQMRRNQEECGRSSSEAFEDIRASLTRIPGWIRNQDWMKRTSSPVFRMSDDEVYWSVEDLGCYLERASKMTQEQVVSGPFTIGGYVACLSVTFMKTWEALNVGIFFSLCPGPRDEDLDWPFTIPFALSLVHPKDRGRDSKKPFDPLGSADTDAFQRPTTGSNRAVGAPCFAAASALREFVLNDAILVCVKLER